MTKWRVLTGIVLATIAVGMSNVRAQVTLTWTNDSGNFTDGFNWDPAQAPADGDTTIFTNDTDYLVSFPVAPAIVTNSFFNGHAGAVTLDLSGQTLNVSSNFSVAQSLDATASVVQAAGTLSAAGFIVGDLGLGSYLLTNGTVVISRQGIVGNSSTGVGTLTISGSTAFVTNLASAGTFTVGNGSTGSALIITNGGKLVTGVAGVGLGTSSRNVATVTGNGSLWELNNNDLRVGFGFGTVSSNSLVITSGGVVSNAARLFIADNSAGSGNSVVINDGGKLFNRGTVTVGAGGGASNNLFQVGGAGAASFATNNGVNVGAGNTRFNQLVVTNATMLSGTGGNVGDSAIGAGTGAANNIGTVTSGGTWNLLNNTLRVGGGGGFSAYSNNTLMVTGGGVVTNVNRVFIADGGGGFGNSLIISNGGKMFVLNALTVAQSAGTVSNSLIVTDGGQLFTRAASAVGNVGSSNNYAIVTGNNSLWDLNNQTLRVGQTAGATAFSNTLYITAGGVVTNVSTIFISDNAAHAANGISISDGGKLFTSGEIRVGTGTASSNNFYFVGGAGASSFVAHGGNVTVGNPASSAFNQMIVTNALINSGTVNVGNNATASNNTLRVLAGGTWVMTLAGSRLNSGGVGSSILIDGGLVTNANGVIIGNTGIQNSMVITNGGKLYSGIAASADLYDIGRNTGAFSNSVSVTGANSLWDAGGRTVIIGNSGSASTNTLRLVDSGVFTNASLTVGGVGMGNRLVLDGGKAVVNTLLGNANNSISFNAGTLNTKDTTINSGLLTVGDGIQAATLELAAGGSGFHRFNGGLTIAANATLRGNGTVTGNATVNGTVAPGFSVGSIVFSNHLTLAGIYEAELDGAGSGSADKLEVVGQLDITGATLSLSQITAVNDDAYVIASYGTLAGPFSAVNNLPAGYQIDYNYLGNNEIAVVVPEPSTAILVGCGLALGVVFVRRRRS
jgi:fibronectin-binding autotransporter adhesin